MEFFPMEYFSFEINFILNSQFDLTYQNLVCNNCQTSCYAYICIVIASV